MSGVSLTMEPRTQPDDQTTTTTTTTTSKSHHQQESQTVMGGAMGSLRVIELQLVAFIMVFSVSGLVPLLDLIFPAFTSAYLLLLSRFVFPSLSPTSTSTSTTTSTTNSREREIFHGGKFFKFYVVLGTTIGLFLPLAYVLGGFARGDEHALRSGTPHLFLLSFQILTENIINGFCLFSPPVRAMVPLLYTVRRIFVILDWIQDVWLYKPIPYNPQFQDLAWNWFGRSLAVGNLVYFSVNLFGFLIPQFLPRAFERYFKDKDAQFFMMKKVEEEDQEEEKKVAVSPRGQAASGSKKTD